MTRNPFRALKRLLAERRNLARREQKLLEQMISALPAATSVNGTRLGKSASERKALTCPRCERRFALPMHLGRHMAMSHRRRRAA